MNFCPDCGSRALPLDKSKENSKLKCTRLICSKVFRPIE